MTSAPKVSPAERLTDLGYRLGWSAVRYAPDSLARSLFDIGGGWAGRHGGGPDQLRRNLARVLGVPAAQVPAETVEAAVRSYARYWYEAFRLPSMDPAAAAASVTMPEDDQAWLAEDVGRGKGVVIALPHSGNWDMAGVWLVRHYGQFATVAERLRPESLFRRFVDYRESLGFEIFPLSGGEQPPFTMLAERLRAGGIICLLGERDLAEHGVEVEFFGEKTRMPAGPVRLAIDTGAALKVGHHWFGDGVTSHVSCGPAIDTSGGVEATTQLLADAYQRNIAAHPTDWHMLQPLWESDWSDERRARIEGT